MTGEVAEVEVAFVPCALGGAGFPFGGFLSAGAGVVGDGAYLIARGGFRKHADVGIVGHGAAGCELFGFGGFLGVGACGGYEDFALTGNVDNEEVACLGKLNLDGGVGFGHEGVLVGCHGH